MNLTKTDLFNQWCFEINRIIDNKLQESCIKKFVDIQIVSDPDSGEEVEYNSYPDLTYEEDLLCRKILQKLYLTIKCEIEKRDCWCFTSSARHVNLDASKLKEEYSLEFGSVYVVLVIEVNDVVEAITKCSKALFSKILVEPNGWCDDDLIALDDSEIINRTKDLIFKKSPLAQFKILESVLGLLKRYEERHEELDYLAPSGMQLKRDACRLFEWIDQSILIITPSIEFQSKSQIDALRERIDFISWHCTCGGNWLTKRFKYLTSVRAYHLNKADKSPFSCKEELTQQSPPAVIIRHLVYGIKSFNKAYHDDPMNVKIWICTLFLGKKGFSYDDVRKALERNQQGYDPSVKSFSPETFDLKSHLNYLFSNQ